jgi:hypothetical protein
MFRARIRSLVLSRLKIRCPSAADTSQLPRHSHEDWRSSTAKAARLLCGRYFMSVPALSPSVLPTLVGSNVAEIRSRRAAVASRLNAVGDPRDYESSGHKENLGKNCAA